MLPAIIGAATSLVGGLLQNKANKKANEAAAAQAQQQYEHQKEFAQSGIQWKVSDAEKAGVHPLYALGANTVSYAPTSVGQSPSNFDFLGETGQNIGRAIDATRSNPAKLEALQTTAAAIQLEGYKLDNDLKKVQLQSAARLANQTGSVPGLPSPFDRVAPEGMAGQGDSPHLPPHHREVLPQHTTNLRMFGRDVAPSPRQSDAQTFEDRYGETISDWIIGPSNAWADFNYNMGPKFAPYRRAARRVLPWARYIPD